MSSRADSGYLCIWGFILYDENCIGMEFLKIITNELGCLNLVAKLFPRSSLLKHLGKEDGEMF